MSESKSNPSPFAKIMVVLAVCFCVGLGLCGLNGVLLVADGASHRAMPNVAPIMGVVGVFSLGILVLSGFGMVLTAIAWVIVGASKNQPSNPKGN